MDHQDDRRDKMTTGLTSDLSWSLNGFECVDGTLSRVHLDEDSIRELVYEN